MVNFIEFPVFDGVSRDLRQWISWLEDFFVRERFTEDEKMNLAQSLLEGEANAWFYRSRKRFAFQSWEHLVVELLLWRFGDFGDFGVFSDLELFLFWNKYNRILKKQRVEKRRKRMETTSLNLQESISSPATIPENITVDKFSNQVDEISAEKKESKQEVDLSMEKIASQLKLPNTKVHVSDSENLRNIETRIENSVLDNFESVVKEAKIQKNIRMNVVNDSKNVSAHQVLDKMCQLKRLKPKNKRKLRLSLKTWKFKFKNKNLQHNWSQRDLLQVIDRSIINNLYLCFSADFGLVRKKRTFQCLRLRNLRLHKRAHMSRFLYPMRMLHDPGGMKQLLHGDMQSLKLKEPVGLVNQRKSRCLKASMFNFKRKKKRIKRRHNQLKYTYASVREDWFNTLSRRENWRKHKHENLQIVSGLLGFNVVYFRCHKEYGLARIIKWSQVRVEYGLMHGKLFCKNSLTRNMPSITVIVAVYDGTIQLRVGDCGGSSLACVWWRLLKHYQRHGHGLQSSEVDNKSTETLGDHPLAAMKTYQSYAHLCLKCEAEMTMRLKLLLLSGCNGEKLTDFQTMLLGKAKDAHVDSLICGYVKFHLKHKWRFRLLQSFSRMIWWALVNPWFSKAYELSELPKDSSNGGAESFPILNVATEQPLLWLQESSDNYLIVLEFEKKKQMLDYMTRMFKYKSRLRNIKLNQSYVNSRNDSTLELQVVATRDVLLFTEMKPLLIPVMLLKLAAEDFGPFQVVELIGVVAYHLQLSPGSKLCDDVFHISQLMNSSVLPALLEEELLMPLQFSFFKLEDKLVLRGESIDTIQGCDGSS